MKTKKAKSARRAARARATEALRIARRAAILGVAALRDGDVAEAREVLTLAQEALDEHVKAAQS